MRTALLVAALAAPLQAQDPGIRQLRLTEEWRIGGEAEDLSNMVPLVIVSQSGRVGVFDGPSARFVLFDGAGKRIGAVGGKGQGPGEFLAGPGGRMFSLERGFHGDSVWVYDNNQRRFAIFAPDFSLARTFVAPPPGATEYVSFDVMSLLPGDRALGVAVSAQGESRDRTFAVIRPDGTIQTRLARVPPDTVQARVDAGDPRARTGVVPFRSLATYRSSTVGDRVAIVTDVTTRTQPATYRVVVVRTTGDTVFARTYPFAPIVVTERMKDSAMARFDERMRPLGSQVGPLRARIEQMLPSTLPPFRFVRVGRDGTIWLNRNGAQTAEFLVLSAAGDVIGVARLPKPNMQVHEMTRSAVWVSETDDDGFFSVVRLRVSDN